MKILFSLNISISIIGSYLIINQQNANLEKWQISIIDYLMELFQDQVFFFLS